MNKREFPIPQSANKMLRRILPKRDGYSLLDSFSHLYSEIRITKGKVRAGLWIWCEIFKSIPGFLYSVLYWRLTMYRNYFLMTWRNVKKHKGQSFINIAGLSLGLTVCLLIYLWIQDEIRYDRFHEQKDRIAQVYSESVSGDGQHQVFMGSYYPLAAVLEEESPDIDRAVRFTSRNGIAVQKGVKIFYNDTIGLADPGFFEIFSFPLLQGSAGSVFRDNHSVVLTEKMARKYFGEEDPIGQILNINGAVDLQITGILRDIPRRSSLQFDCLIPFVWIFEGEKEPSHWGGNPLDTWVLLKPGVDTKGASQRITAIIDKYNPPRGNQRAFWLHPLVRLHLYSPLGNNLSQTLMIFSFIAVLVLLIACINFMNLSTAQASIRSREVGVRKVVGARRADLVRQFIGESMLITLITMGISLLLIFLVLPAFNQMMEKELSFSILFEPGILLGCLGIVLVTGIFSGSYPAFYLSALMPSEVFFRRISGGPKKAVLRKAMVIAQFSISIALIICTMVLFRQVGFLQTKDLGFDRENLATLQIGEDLQNQYGALKTELLHSRHVISVTRALQHPAYISSTVGALDWEGRNPGEPVTFNWDYVGFDYFKTLDLELVEGRAFSRDFPSDLEGAYIVNEKAVALMGMDHPVGRRLSVFREEGRIVGIVKNFHFQPLYYDIKPFVFILQPNTGGNIFMRLQPGEKVHSEVLAHVTSVFHDLSPNHPVYIGYFNDLLMRYIYTTEKRIGKASIYFTVMAVFISCLGLFGLAAFMAAQKTKEISIRKILGASSSRLIFMLSGEFTKWVVFANVIACPAAYFVSRKLLSRYVFKIGIGWDIFFLSGLAALLIALATVGFQSYRAAAANPVDNLRYE